MKFEENSNRASFHSAGHVLIDFLLDTINTIMKTATITIIALISISIILLFNYRTETYNQLLKLMPNTSSGISKNFRDFTTALMHSLPLCNAAGL